LEPAGLTPARTFHQPWPFPISGYELGDVEYALDGADRGIRTGWAQSTLARAGPAGRGRPHTGIEAGNTGRDTGLQAS
jgi:hypothetical protein